MYHSGHFSQEPRKNGSEKNIFSLTGAPEHSACSGQFPQMHAESYSAFSSPDIFLVIFSPACSTPFDFYFVGISCPAFSVNPLMRCLTVSLEAAVSKKHSKQTHITYHPLNHVRYCRCRSVYDAQWRLQSYLFHVVINDESL